MFFEDQSKISKTFQNNFNKISKKKSQKFQQNFKKKKIYKKVP